MVIDLPPFTLPDLFQANPYLIIAAAIVSTIVMATSKQPKYLLLTIPFLIVSSFELVISMWYVYQWDSVRAVLLVLSGIGVSWIWRNGKPDPIKK